MAYKRWTWLFAALAALQCGGALAQAKPEDILSYQGPDRDKRLLEQAKQEGMLALYTSLAPTESKPLAAAFEKKTGIKVELWRSQSERVVQRVLSEAQAGRHVVDVIATNGPQMESLAREKILTTYFTPHAADLPPASIPGHRLWMPDRLQFFVVGYNTNLVQREDLPKSIKGFVDPKWKGKLSVEAGDAEWMATLVKKWGEAEGMAVFRKLSELRPTVRKGHPLLAQLIAAGEIAVCLTAYSANVETLKRKGAPIDFAPIDAVARTQGIGISKNAPHPAAALLFADFVLSAEDGQRLYESMGRPPVNRKVKSKLTDFEHVYLDIGAVLDEADKWDKLWEELFLKK
ncbi:MAG: ABC transporter substrate-binding protein [Betaproteobacteria bacterium RIFCSPLOWO2_02_FULL_67_26]|nr:MAG: ABC transporter substrate-binding protein [Betaproteobacteria bacterium RIFCSPLOWO2_02_FULL_67_26]